MKIKLDLHIHSYKSYDGRMTGEEIVRRCKAQGLQGAAICDHDILWQEGCPEEDFLLIPGCEFSTQYGHLLGLFLREPIEERDFFKVLDAIHAQGGLAVLAHPFQHNTDEKRLEPILPLLDGVEVWNGRANRKNKDANRMALALSRQRSIPAFAGSDAHVPEEIGNGVLTIEVEELTFESVKKALRAGGESSGREGKSIYVAASQLTKRRKQKAKPAAYVKWAAFYMKCCLEDCFRKRG